MVTRMGWSRAYPELFGLCEQNCGEHGTVGWEGSLTGALERLQTALIFSLGCFSHRYGAVLRSDHECADR